MAGSNERGRALEYRVAKEVEILLRTHLKLDITLSENTQRLNAVHKKYFDVLDAKTNGDFNKCAITFANWLGTQEWLSGVTKVTMDRLGDDKAKDENPADIRLVLTKKDGTAIVKNFSLKNKHNALKHPRMPSLAQQCGFQIGSEEDKAYRASYGKIWEYFGEKVKKLNAKIKTFADLKKIDNDFKVKHLYVPLQESAAAFLLKCSQNAANAKAFFEYLVGKEEYVVVKNAEKELEIKYFNRIATPKSFSVTYPYKFGKADKRNYLLLSFDNGWNIVSRIHNASSRIFENGVVNKTEKLDPICTNLEELITIEKCRK